MNDEILYFLPEDLYRIGNSSSPLMTKIRAGEITLMEINGITTIVANNKGISLFSERGLTLAPLTGWVYELKRGTPIPSELHLYKDPLLEGHYMLCPLRNMPVRKYAGLLDEIAVHCYKVFKKTA